MNYEQALASDVMKVLRKLGWVGTTMPDKNTIRAILKKAGYYVYESGRIVRSISERRVGLGTAKEIREVIRNWRIEDDIPKEDRKQLVKMLEEHFEKAINVRRNINEPWAS